MCMHTLHVSLHKINHKMLRDDFLFYYASKFVQARAYAFIELVLLSCP